MSQQVLIIGGGGRIGRSVAADLLRHTDVGMTLTGRRPQASFALHARQRYQPLRLDDRAGVRAAISAHDLVINCAGPIRTRDFDLLAQCIAQKTP